MSEEILKDILEELKLLREEVSHIKEEQQDILSVNNNALTLLSRRSIDLEAQLRKMR